MEGVVEESADGKALSGRREDRLKEGNVVGRLGPGKMRAQKT